MGMITRLQGFALQLFTVLALTGVMEAARADSKQHIDSKSQEALVTLRDYSPDAGGLLDEAAGVLVFPDVVKMGFGVGGQYGEGSLLVDNQPVAYYATAGASFGLQLGAQFKAEVILFMTEEALQNFRNSQGWEVGVDGSVAVVAVGAGGKIDSKTVAQPVVAFIFSNKGLMYNLTLEGSKITRIAR
jgi:lipid-binding SYLF domain-containing protein